MGIERTNQGSVALGQGTRCRVVNDLTQPEVLEEAASPGLVVHGVSPFRRVGSLSRTAGWIALAAARCRRAGRMASITVLAAGAATSLGGAVMAGSLQDAQQKFCAGEWHVAAADAENDRSAAGYLLASVGWRVHGRYGRLKKGAREDAYDRAIHAAEQGLTIDSGDYRLRVALSSALARRCSLQPVRCVLENIDLKRARQELETALSTNPADPETRAALGAWHARAGVAGVFAGADVAEGRRLLEESEPEVGENIPLLFEMARAWRDLGDRERAASLYRKAFELPSDCAWDREIQKRARGYYKEVSGS